MEGIFRKNPLQSTPVQCVIKEWEVTPYCAKNARNGCIRDAVELKGPKQGEEL
jgi:hypothetical protein